MLVAFCPRETGDRNLIAQYLFVYSFLPAVEYCLYFLAIWNNVGEYERDVSMSTFYYLLSFVIMEMGKVLLKEK